MNKQQAIDIITSIIDDMIIHADKQVEEWRKDLAQKTIDTVYPLKEALSRIRNQS